MSNRDFYTVPEMPQSNSGGSTGDTMQQAQDKAGQALGTAQQKDQGAADTAKQKTSQAADQAQVKADQGMDKAASGLGQAADKLRQQGEQRGGTAASVATTTAEKLDSASQYLREKDTNQILDDVEALVRRKPVESLLVAAGVGFLLSKVLR